MWYNYFDFKFALKGRTDMKNERTINFNNGWEFHLTENGTDYSEACAGEFRAVEIPHDWLIYDAENLYKSGDGWYRKNFSVNCKGNKAYRIEFDCVYMDSTVYANDKKAGDWHYGYSSFAFDITDLVEEGENTVVVQVRYKSPNSRWYSGAGIYRNVHLTVTDPVHIAYNGIYISADGSDGKVKVSTEGVGEYDFVRYRVYDAQGKELLETQDSCFYVNDYKMWGLDDPYLYTLKAEVVKDRNITDECESIFGFRTIKFDPDEGFFLNGEYMKLKGVCLHHDLGALGAAVNYSATERQIKLMKDMGVNAVRTAHNMPSRELLEICDRMGMLVNSESFDMWENPKTEFDNARFFKETAHDDVLSWVKGDRNHPCVIMWSIGNEIYDTHASDHGYEIAEMLVNYVREADPEENAVVTIGSNFIEWERAQKIGEMLVHSGYNYTEKCYDDHHKKYPTTVIYGSETSSAVRSRGIYHFPADMPQLSHDDHQCSSLANSCVGWGRPSEDAWIQDRNRKFCAGQFVWTGIDYIGEPTPYSTKNSFFGMADTACFPKDIYYFYQSVWTDVKTNPMIHLLPYWDFNEGQIIDVIAYTNASKAELFLNGKSLGIKEIDHKNGTILHAEWKVPYEKGTLTVKAMDLQNNIIAEDTQKSFGEAVKVTACTACNKVSADGNKLCFVEIGVVDENGTPVANARNRVKVEVSGAGRLLGLDNGDSTDYEQYKTDSRRLFSGKLLAIIGSDGKVGEINVKISSMGLESAELTVISEGEGDAEKIFVPQIRPSADKSDVPVRKIEASVNGGGVFDENRTEAEVICKIFPENATYNDLTCTMVKSNGVETNIAEAEYRDGNFVITAKGDGECIFRIYANNGSEYPQVISDVPIKITGLGEAVRSPYSMTIGGNYNISSMPLNVIEDNALGGFTEKCWAGYSSFDFGKTGSEVLRLYIGNCANRDIPIEVWDGIPEEEGSVKLITAMFPHNNCWNSSEPYDFALPAKLNGMHNICFVIAEKCIFGGFEFIKSEKAYAQLNAGDNDNVYGDDFEVKGSCVEKIGNNVVLEFTDMDFGDGTCKLEVYGRTPNEINTIQLRYTENGARKTQLLEFAYSDEYIAREFEIEKISGITDVSFVFMPGSKFDFGSFRFVK